MNKLLVICGPTATGKTKLGIELAKKFNGEIVSADSRQVYRGMDVGTGKDLSVNPKFKVPAFAEASAGKQNSKLQFKIQNFGIGFYEIDGVKVWLLDIVEPDYKFNVADYKKCADVVLEDIWKRGKLPIIVGGTGFYIKAIVDGIGTMGIKPDWELRDKLSNCRIDELQISLKRMDPEKWERMNESDRQNPRRLIRAIEVATKTQNSNLVPPAKPLATHGKSQNQNSKLKTDNLIVGLTAPFSTLYQRIDQRVEERIKDGLEDEIRGLLAKGYNFENSVLGTTLAYSEWKDFFKKKVSKEEIVQKWKYDEHNYARRQMTWFKKALRQAQGKTLQQNCTEQSRSVQGEWFDISDEKIKPRVENLVKNWYIKVDGEKN